VLLKLIAKEICMQPTLIRLKLVLVCEFVSISLVYIVSEPLTFHWNGVLVTRTFETYEFLEPVAMCVTWKLLTIVSLAFLFRNLIIRYLRDQNHRNQRAQKRSSSSEHHSEFGPPLYFHVMRWCRWFCRRQRVAEMIIHYFRSMRIFHLRQNVAALFFVHYTDLLLRCLLVQMFFFKVYVICLYFRVFHFDIFALMFVILHLLLLIFVVNILTCRLCFACPFRWFSAHHAPAPVCCRNFYGKTCKRSNIKLLQAM